MKYQVEPLTIPLERPFVITGHTFINLEAVMVTLEKDGHLGRGEGDGVYYLGESQDSMFEQLEAIRAEVEKGVTRDELAQLLPAGGARNALDCALWDLGCKSEGKSIWESTGIKPKSLTTVATVGMGTPEEMAARALEFSKYRNLKIKLDDQGPLERLEEIRSARPDANLVIDVNQGWNVELLQELMPRLVEFSVAMIEQPLPRGADKDLAGCESPIPLGADESCLTLEEYFSIKDYYQVINIKLDKTGGLTEALRLAEQAKADGKDVMVGNMTGTSLSMAAAYVIGQFCTFVDIDGPLLLGSDINDGLKYLEGGLVDLPSRELWG